MRFSRPAITTALFVVCLACVHSSSNNASSGGDEAANDDDRRTKPSEHAGTCEGVGTSNLDGVCIAFASAEGTWTLAEAAAGISIPYEIVVEADVANVIVAAQDAGSCDGPGPSGLIVFERLSGNDQEYCECDSGLCPSPEDTPVTIHAGRSAESFEWTGHNWYGASDTSNPLGPAFPPGRYTLEVSARGTVDGAYFEVRNQFTVELVP